MTIRRPLILIAALLLCVPAPPATATHLAPDVETPEVPAIPEEAFAPTGIIPVDEQQRDVARGGNSAGRLVTMEIENADARARRALDESGAPGLIPYLFDDHAGARHGGIGPWSVQGGGWSSAPSAYVTAGDAAGRYEGSLDSLLVLPAVDLENGLRTRERDPVPDPAVRESSLYRFAVQHANYALNDECSVGVTGTCYPWMGAFATTDADPQDGLYLFEFEHRQNLARGRDGVQVLVFTQAPDVSLAGSCIAMRDQRDGQLAQDVGVVQDLPCTRLETIARAERPTTAADGEPALTGLADWTTDAVDLTPWAGRTIWVALRFVTTGVSGASYFRSAALFDQDAGFFGFQLGNVSVTGPADGGTLRVRDPIEPSFVPRGATGPTVARGATVHFESDILNLATRATNVTLRLDVDDLDEQHRLVSRQLGTFFLAPGASHRVVADVDGVTDENKTLRFTLRVSPDSPSHQRNVRLGLPNGDATVEVDVRDIEAVEFGDLQRPTGTAAKGDLLTFRMPITNLGTVQSTVVAKAQVIHAGLKTPTGALEFQDGSADRTVVVPAGKTVDATWEVLASEPGQYNLFVRVNDERPFDAAIDLLPVGLRAHQVPFLPEVQPTVDGVMRGGEWPSSTTQVVEYGDLYAGHQAWTELSGNFSATTDGDRLWLAAAIANEVPDPADRFEVYLDRGAGQPVLVAANETWLVDDAIYEVVDAAGPLGDAATLFRDTAGRPMPGGPQPTATLPGTPSTWEASIPLQGPTSFQPLPGHDPRILVRFVDSSAGDKRFPPAPLANGEGFTPADANGTLRDEMDSWFALKVPQQALAGGIGSVRTVSPGFGVDRAPPALLEVDLDSCADLVGWSQTGIANADVFPATPSNTYSPNAAKWNCGPYGPDGKTRLYEGRAPGAACQGAQCPPWSGSPANHITRRAHYYDALVSPAIRLASVERPYLVLRHQYADKVLINDEDATVTKYPADTIAANTVEVYERERVYIQLLDETTGEWGEPILLQPDGGYTTMEDNGVAHRFETPYTITPVEGKFTPGWWWPTGAQPYARAPGEVLANGVTFSGSPWAVDRVPLFGYGHGVDGTQAITPANRTIRLLFETVIPSTDDIDLDLPYDFGWRIEGLAISEGERFALDLAAAALVVQPGAADVARIGLGPGVDVAVNVTVANEGLSAASGADVCVVAADLRSGVAKGDPCDHPAAVIEPLVGILKPGERRNVTVMVPGAPDGAILTFSASVRPFAGDDFPGDNLLRDAAGYTVQAHPDLAVFVAAPTVIGSADDSFPFEVILQNRGNMPLSGLAARRTFEFEDGPKAGQEMGLVGKPLVWEIPGTLGVGETRFLKDLVPDIGFGDLIFPAPLVAGRFTIKVEAALPGDAQPADNLDALRLRTVDVLLHESFASANDLAPGSLEGTSGVWSVKGGSLVAGALGEMPAHADSSVRLTQDGPIDLRGARGATLTLRHRFDLEASPQSGFDAGVVEVSTDGGASWRPLKPAANPLLGLPGGYSSLPLAGDSILVADGQGGPGTAFAGSSYGLPGTVGGWIESSFDLAQDPLLSRPGLVQVFDLEGLPSQPLGSPVEAADGSIIFTNPAWALAEPSAALRHRTWSIHNVTYSEPAPHGGAHMWWSGSTDANADDEPATPVHTGLNYTFPAPAASHPDLRFDRPLGDPQRVRDRLLLTWWEWRDGHQDGGTGADFTVLVGDDAADQAADPLTLEARPDGWTLRALDLTARVGQSVAVSWDYDSVERPDLPDPSLESNRGWFLDDVALAAYDYDALRDLHHSRFELPGFSDGAEAPPGPGWSTWAHDGTSGTWSRAVRGDAGRPGGWHIDQVTIPGIGTVAGWRFAADNGQGYPHGADSRLVTPLIDLSDAGSDVRLAFDQQYGLEAFEQCQQVTSYQEEECFRSAVDAGAVEVQVYDPAAGTFGPWKQVGARFDEFPARMLLDDNASHVTAECDGVGDHKEDPAPPANDNAWVPSLCHDHDRMAERRRTELDDVLPWQDPLDASGYTGVEDRTPRLHITHDVGGKPQDLHTFPRGHGSTFEAFPASVRATFRTNAHLGFTGAAAPKLGITVPWQEGNVSYVFTGESPGNDGWASMSWDIAPLAGKQVRFAFHAFSNPSHTATQSTDDHPGWAVANVRVESRRFIGQPVDLRLRMVTDESLGFGEWSIDEAKLVGSVSNRNAAVLAAAPSSVAVADGAVVKLDGTVAALGRQTLAGLHLAVQAIDEDRQEALPAEAVVLQVTGAEQRDPDLVPGSQALVALPSLDLGFRPEVPVRLTIDLPQDARRVSVRWTLLQDGPQGLRPAALDDPANAFATWEISASDELAVRFLPPAPDASAIVVSPARPQTGEPVTLQTRVLNDGTLALDDTAIAWKVLEVERKAGPDQPHVGKEKTTHVASMTTPVGDLAPGSSGVATMFFTPPRVGLYRIVADVVAGPEEDLETETFEILVGLPSALATADFTDGTLDGWGDASDPVDTTRGGGSHDELRFRLADGSLLWGVDNALYQQGVSYCAYGSCNFAVEQDTGGEPAEPPSVVGLEGIAIGPPIDLTRVPQGKAFLSLRHSNLLEDGDGARVELVPYKAPYDPKAPRPVYTCGPGPAGQSQGRPIGFVLTPQPDAEYDEVLRSAESVYYPGVPQSRPHEKSPDRHNPLVASLADSALGFGGQDGERVTRFDLDQAAIPACRDGANKFPDDLVLVNYVVVPVLRVGTLPGHGAILDPQLRSGAQGWQIKGFQVSTSDLGAAPSAATWGVQPGAAKTFLVTVTNPSSVADDVSFAFVTDRLQLPDPAWVTLPGPTTIGPGETLQVPVHVSVPVGPGARPGLYAAPMAVESRTDPSLVRILDISLQVRDVAVPDLAARLSSDPGARFLAGSVEPLHVTVDNLGRIRSHDTSVAVWAQTIGGADLPIASIPLGSLCPQAPADPAPCTSGPSQRTLSTQWNVPDDVGPYRLMARVDPVGSLLDAAPANNVDVLDVSVTADLLPDLAVSGLRIEGVNEQGIAEEGQLLRISVDLTNQGNAPATDVRLSIRFESSQIKDLRMPALAPGQTVHLEAVKVASRGQFTVVATAASSGADADPVNDDQSVFLRVRGHDLTLTGPATPPTLAAGGSADVGLVLANEGNTVDRVVLRIDPRSPGWSLAALPNPATVSPRQSLPVQVVLRAPDAAPAGDTVVLILAEPAGAPGRGTLLEVAVHIELREGAPSVVAAPMTAAPGRASLDLALRSRANVAQDLAVALDPDWGDATIRLPAGAALDTSVPVTIPAGAAVGIHEVAVIVRTTGGAELTRTLAQVNVTGAPRIETQWLSPFRTSGELGERAATFPLRVINAGNVPAQAVLDLLDLVRGTNMTIETRLLLPGETEDLSLSLRRGAGEGEDWNGRVAIRMLANGTPDTPLPSLELPPLEDAADLVVARLDVAPAQGLRAGRPAQLVFTVENRGALPSPPTTLHASANGVLIEVLQVPALEPGARTTLETSWTFDRPGSFVIAAQADPGSQLSESIEDNGALADLEVGEPDLATRLHDVPGLGLPLAVLALAALLAMRRRSP